jgi:hypothetical protein
MSDVGYTKPTNAILVYGEPEVQFLKIETVANCYPGRLVKKDTADYQVEVCGAAGVAVGWLGYEQTEKSARPATVDTIYTVNKTAAVLHGGKFGIVGRLASGENATKGNYLVAAANGELAVADAITIAASGAANITDGQGVAGTIPAGGMPVAKALESVDASGGAADIMVESLI